MNYNSKKIKISLSDCSKRARSGAKNPISMLKWLGTSATMSQDFPVESPSKNISSFHFNFHLKLPPISIQHITSTITNFVLCIP